MIQATVQINGHDVRITSTCARTPAEVQEIALWTRDLENRLRAEAGYSQEVA